MARCEQVDSTSCDFPFLEVFDGRVTIITFFDSEGNPIRATFHLPFHGTLTNEATGESVSADQVLQEMDDLEEGTVSWLGPRFCVTFPGLGSFSWTQARSSSTPAANLRRRSRRSLRRTPGTLWRAKTRCALREIIDLQAGP